MKVSRPALPNQKRGAATGINTTGVRQRMAETLRGLPDLSLANAPADTDFANPKMAAELEEAFGGCGYTALQRAALLKLAWDQVSSGLDGREAAFGIHASGGAGGVAPPMVVLVRKLRPVGEWCAGVYPGRPASKRPEQAAEGAASSPQNASISTGTLNIWATK